MVRSFIKKYLNNSHEGNCSPYDTGSSGDVFRCTEDEESPAAADICRPDYYHDSKHP